jgi:hypothetical protein
MIQRLSDRYSKHLAFILLFSFSLALIPPSYAGGDVPSYYRGRPDSWLHSGYKKPAIDDRRVAENASHVKEFVADKAAAEDFIGGPSQPEMSAFKSAGTNDLVNLFTGDFSYNIPLMDVGGYPVNIFYNAGISMEQEASWVGLGWNINPGTISRNMRGVPDDFDGTEEIVQEQNIKPNITWGGRIGADVELVGVKDALGFSIGVGLGASFNNYLGPALDFGLKGGVSFKVANLVGSEKRNDSLNGSLSVGINVGADLNSRTGLTINPNISLSSRMNVNNHKFGVGIGASTSYNSRTGIKSLTLYEQASMSYQSVKDDPKKARPGSMGANLYGATLSFNKPSYVPAMRMPVTNSAYSGQFQIGGAFTGFYGSAEVEVYKQESSVAFRDRQQRKPMFGYMYAQKAAGNANAIMDFTRFNDKEVTSKTAIISVPQYAYDVFSISGEGTGGTIRAYRNDNGHVRDNKTTSKDASISIGADVGIPGHIGANFNMIKTPSTSGDWEQGNKLRNALPFKSNGVLSEQVYFRNPGESSVLNEGQFDRIGGTDLVRFRLGGSNSNPTVEPVLERFDANKKMTGTINLASMQEDTLRKKRTQVISFLTASEASVIGLEPSLRDYNNATPVVADTLLYNPLNRIDAGTGRNGHHISEINITEADGKRYVYGLPVYNIRQKEYTVTVSGAPDANDLVNITTDEIDRNRTFPSDRDGYMLTSETPAYAHSFLLTGLLSPDYVDVTGNGITEDDLGSAVKFNYSKMPGLYKWRTPYSNNSVKAHYNSGSLSDDKDDKGIVTYGERESWYVHSIESKTMIAFFRLEDRSDNKGVAGVMNGINTSDASVKRLQRIDLYNKADIRKNGVYAAKPIKTVWFEYDYSLCADAPGNTGFLEMSGSTNVNGAKGKLTLKGIYFTFNGQTQNNRGKKNRYAFNYASTPAYYANASDRWGTYKPKEHNPQGLKNSVYPYTPQHNPANVHTNAVAWNLNKILLPSGGQIEVSYESDDYAFVQDRRATSMMAVTSLGRDAMQTSNRLYDITFTGQAIDNDKVYISVPEPCANKAEVFAKYLSGLRQLAFRLAVKMPKGKEYITVYAFIQDYGIGANSNTIWVQLKKVDGYSPLSLSAIEYLREYLPAQAFTGYAPEGNSLQQFGQMIGGMIDGLKGAFKNPVNFLREQNKAQTIELAETFVRLNVPSGKKYGGGHRVRSVRIKDNWNAMTGQFTAEYGQQYTYTTTEVFNGTARTISSGVASYEPSIGGEENPFQEILQVANRLPLGPATYEAIELPVLDAFFPAPLVGYSKVTVRSIKSGELRNNKKARSGIGRQVTEFYTAKDFPVRYSHTSFDPSSDKQEHGASLFAFFRKWSFDSRALSQGFVVELNDMHGKMKSQSSYGETDPDTRLSYTEYFYRNTGANGLNEKFDFVHGDLGGQIKSGNMGIDVELMTDTREFSVKSSSMQVQAQVDWMIPFPTIWLPFIWPVFGKSESYYRAVTTTKVISYHSVTDSVVVIDKGSVVTTRNLVFDAETGNVVVSRTNNEFDKPLYQTTYPAYWAYSGMSTAYKNIDAQFKNVAFRDGKVIGGIAGADMKRFFESGDEIYIVDAGSDPAQQVRLTGMVSKDCSDKNCTEQGAIGLTFTFSSPTPVPLTIQVGEIIASGTGKAVGYDLFALPPGVTANTYYFQSNRPFQFTIPQGTSTITFPKVIDHPGISAPYAPRGWVCHDCLFPITSLYIKGFSANSLYETFFTTEQNYQVQNISVNAEDCVPPISSNSIKKLWAVARNKDVTSLTVTDPDFVFVDASGRPYTRENVSMRIVRSGKRNMLQAQAASVTTLADPVTGTSTRYLNITNASNVLNASSVEYKEKWQTDKGVIGRFRKETLPQGSNLVVNGDFSSGATGFSSEYTYFPTSYSSGGEGRYTIRTVTSGWLSSSATCYDHTSGSGNMMVVNGHTVANRAFWYQTINVQPGQDYAFAMWAQSINTSNIPSIKVLINNIVVTPVVNLSSNCKWVNIVAGWNAGLATTATIRIIDTKTAVGGNDFAVDDISFNAVNCGFKEVADCNGYLEEQINPYRKGLLGSFKSHRSLLFYGDRINSNAITPTNIVTDGPLTGFDLYWKFNGANNLVPVPNQKWVWSSEITRVNSKGLELETKNALNIYTSAQYGYQKSLPVAIASNARYHEMFYAGFEDAFYEETLNKSSSLYCSSNEHVFFDKTKIVMARSEGIKAHTGKHVIKVAGGTSLKTDISMKPVIDDFTLIYQRDTVRKLNDYGGNVDSVVTGNIQPGWMPNPVAAVNSQFSFYGAGASIQFDPVDTFYTGWRSSSVRLYASQYVRITQPGSYYVNLNNSYSQSGTSSGFPRLSETTVEIIDSSNTLVFTKTLYTSGNYSYNGSDRVGTFLCKGIYKVRFLIRQATSMLGAGDGTHQVTENCTFSYSIDNGAAFYIPTYKSLSTLGAVCFLTRPITGKDSMMNPVVSIAPGKRMLLSAWVREYCADPCSKLTYSDGKVNLIFRDAAGNQVGTIKVLSATGPIIEGWQKIEGDFTAPAGSVKMELILVNSGSATAFFDDIRVHPYQANMKSFVYDPVNLRLSAEMDANNYATLYEYDEEGVLIRTKVETEQGVKTVNETRSAKQKDITSFQ